MLTADSIVSAVVLGSSYTLIAIAWVIIFRATEVLNFATGQFLLLGTFGFFTLAVSFELPFLLALVAGLLFVAIVVVVGYLVVLRPLEGQPAFSAVIVTLGLSVVLTSAMSIIWGSSDRLLPKPIKDRVLHLPFDATITTYGIATVVAAVIVLGALFVLFRFSNIGFRMRAAAELPLLASHRGINVSGIYALSWAIAAVAASVAGIGYAYTNVLTPSAGQLALRGLAPALVGGLDSIGGALVGGMLVALVEIIGVTYLGGAARDATAFGVLLLFLLIRPYGLFGTPEIRRV